MGSRRELPGLAVPLPGTAGVYLGNLAATGNGNAFHAAAVQAGTTAHCHRPRGIRTDLSPYTRSADGSVDHGRVFERAVPPEQSGDFSPLSRHLLVEAVGSVRDHA